MNNPPSTAADDQSQRGPFGEIWAFLNRDVRTFKWGRNKPRPATAGAHPPEFKSPTSPLKEQEPDVVSEVDARRIDGLRFRRDVLDWRDEFQFNVTEAASRAQETMVETVDHELANLNFWRLRLFTKPASEVLEGHIESCIRSRMRRTTQIEQAVLRQHLLTWPPHRQDSSSIWTMWPKLEWDTRLSLKFTADNRDRILTVLGELILGENGLADTHRQWATQYAIQFLETPFVQPNSV